MQNRPKNPTELDFLSYLALRVRTNTGANRRASPVEIGPALRLGIGDDCALLRPPPGSQLAVTTDFSLENRHFLRRLHPPESVGHRTLARGLSDLAAMGATPLAAFLSLALPADALRGGKNSWSARFLDGLLSLTDTHHIPLAGGDTSESPNSLILADIVLIGSLPKNRALLPALLRSGARPGDSLYVTGSLGGAAAELAALTRNPKRFAALKKFSDGHPHLYPQPRIAVGHALLHSKSASACIDLSDGLSTDLVHLCRASNVAAQIQSADLPIAPGATLDDALNGGEDYELLFSAPASRRIPKKIAGVPITRIGIIVARKKGQPLCASINSAGKSVPLPARGFEHFRSRSENSR
jgi:thiamine-monophosphate kinase